MVVVYHFYLFDLGWIGVNVFFVLSGFLMTGILLSRKESLDTREYWARFWRKRVLRIFPPYYLLLAMVAVAAFMTNWYVLDAGTWWRLLSFTYNYDLGWMEGEAGRSLRHLWSLSVEMQFYLLWPLAVWFLPAKRLKQLCWALVAGIPLVRWALPGLMGWSLDDPGVGGVVYQGTLTQIDAFAIGGLVYLSKDFLIQWKLLLQALWISVFLLLCAGLLNWLMHWSNPIFTVTAMGYPCGSTLGYQHVWSYTLINLVAAIAIAYAWKYPQEPQSLAGKWGKGIGKISYGMYVYHQLILFAAMYFLPMPDSMGLRWLIFVPVFMLIWAVSWLSYRFVELPIMRRYP